MSILKNELQGFPGGPVAKIQSPPKAGGPHLIPGQGTRSHMQQLNSWVPQLRPGTVK